MGTCCDGSAPGMTQWERRGRTHQHTVEDEILGASLRTTHDSLG